MIKRLILLSSIFAACVTSALSQMLPPPGGGYVVTYTTYFSTNADGVIHTGSSGQSTVSVTGVQMATSGITTIVEVTYTGTGTPPPDTYIRITPNSMAEATGGAWQLTANDNLASKEVHAASPGSETLTLEGGILKKIVLGANGKMTFKLKAFVDAVSSVNSTLTASAGFNCTIVDRGIDLVPSNPVQTYRRGDGGVAIANDPDEDNPVGRIDVAMLPEYFSSWVESGWLRARYELSGAAVGTWISSVTFTWDPDASTKWIYPLSTTISHMWEYAYRTDPYDAEVVKAALAQDATNYFFNPATKHQGLTASDSLGTLSTRLPVYIHGPLESTSEAWEAPYAGHLNDCATLMAQTNNKFMPKLLGSLSNVSATGGPDIDCDVNINRSFSVTTGVEISSNYGFELTEKILKLVFGQNISINSSTTYAVNQTHSFGFQLAPGKEFRIWYGATGAVTFPLVARYNSTGYAGDIAMMDVRGLTGFEELEVVTIGSSYRYPLS